MARVQRSSGDGGRKALYLILTVLLIVFLFYYVRHRFQSAPALETPSGFPELATKPTPVASMFHDCPPEGDGGDPDLNRLKNRIDDGQYLPVDLDAILALAWPPETERRHRAKWSGEDLRAVQHYEGTPLIAEGYLLNVKEEGPESPNCHGADHAFRDFHIWLAKSPDDDRSKSVVVELTPPLREKHPGWNIHAVRWVVKNRVPVRISGWLLLDPEHPDQVGKTRGTIWEIHPIMQIDVQQGGAWKPLEDVAPAGKEDEGVS